MLSGLCCFRSWAWFEDESSELRARVQCQRVRHSNGALQLGFREGAHILRSETPALRKEA